MITASRYHDISCGHRVVGHENKCRYLHGHNYRVHFTCAGPIDAIGRVLDFSIIKQALCQWLEDHWDHKLLIWENDPLLPGLRDLSPDSIASVPFNPTAENMAKYLTEIIGPIQLHETGVKLIKCTIEETAKCHASYSV